MQQVSLWRSTSALPLDAGVGIGIGMGTDGVGSGDRGVGGVSNDVHMILKC